MKKLDEIRIITKDEARILFKALHPWFMKQLKKLPEVELLKINQLYDDIRYFVNEDEET